MNFTASAIAIVAASLFLAWLCAGKKLHWRQVAPLLLAVAATLLRIWLTLDRRLIVEGGAAHDARLFVWQGAHIVEGLWLGQYNYLTLIKGPFIGLWMSMMFYLGVPYLLSLHLLYVGCSALMVRALRPVMMSTWAALALYLVLLFNPLTYSVQVAAVVSRMGIYQPLTLGVTACAIGLYLRWGRPFTRTIAWAGGLGVMLGCFLITREAGIWIVPMLLVLLLAGVWKSRQTIEAAWTHVAAPLAIVSLLALVIVQGVAYLNWKHYSLWEVTEFGDPSFKAAYGALSRIVPKENLPYVPVARSSRVKAYANSPAFAELERHLEGRVGLDWAKPGMELVGLPAERREMAGGWFMWAFREAAMLEEYHVWPTAAVAYYQRVADEVNTACDAGRIECYPSRTGFAPVWRPEWRDSLPRALLQSLGVIAGFDAYASSGSESSGQDWVVQMFSEISRTRTVPRAEDERVYDSVDRLSQFKQKQLRKIAAIYQALGPWGALVGLFGLLTITLATLAGHAAGSRGALRLFPPILAVFSSLFVYALMLSMIHISSFEVMRQKYLFAVSSQYLLLVFLSLYAVIQAVCGADDSSRELDF